MKEKRQPTFDFNTTVDKHYFVGYLNTIENNIFRVMQACETRYSLEKIKNNKNGHKYIQYITGKEGLFPDNLAPSVFIKRVEYLKTLLPFTKYIHLESSDSKFKNDEDKELKRIKYFKTSFQTIYGVIHKLRNHYTHYYEGKLDFSKNSNSKKENIYQLLDAILLSCASDVFNKKKKSDHTREALDKELEEELIELKKLKLEKLKESKKKNKGISLDTESINNAVFNDAFKHIIYKKSDKGKEAKYELQDVFQANQYDKNSVVPLSKNSFVFLLCLFLDKKQGNDLRHSISGFENTKIPIEDVKSNFNSLKFHATHWVYSALSFKEIKGRLNTDFDRETLLSQIVNYLGKVPHELYQVLDEKQQKEFCVNFNERQKSSNEEEEETIDIIQLSIKKRYENKFNYFVLKFLDKYIFNKIKLQIVLGKYVHHQAEKKIFGTNKTENRIIDEKIKVFGKLIKIINLKKDYFEQNKEKENDFRLAKNPNPSYCIKDNKIPIYFESSKNKQKNETTTRKAGKKNKSDIVDYMIENTKNYTNVVIAKSPTAILSLNELPALLHHFFTEIEKIDKNNKEVFDEEKKKIAAALEDKIIKKYENLYDAIRDFEQQDTKNIKDLKQIPKSFNKAPQKLKFNHTKLLNGINNEEEKLNDRLNKLYKLKNEKKEKKRKFNKDYPLFNKKILGKNANWLAKEIIRCMPSENRENWKGYQHSHLQYCISMFKSKKIETYNLLNNCWFFDKQEDDSLSLRIKNLIEDERGGIERLYESFIKIIQEELELIRVFINKNTREEINSHPVIWRFFKKRDFTSDTLSALKEKFLKKPLLLPRGLFDNKPSYIKGKNVTTSPDEFAKWVVYIHNQKNYQSFYSYERNYDELFNKHNDSSKSISENKRNLSEKQQKDTFIFNHNKKIKKVQHQDIFLKEIVNFLYSEVTSSSKKVFELEYFYKKNHEDNDIDAVWNKTIDFEEGQIKDKVKIKDIGKFKKFMGDDKVEKIFSYDEDKKWSWKELIDELLESVDSYEVIRREKLFKLIHNLEKHILGKYEAYKNNEHPEELEYKQAPNFNYYVYKGLKEEKLDKKFKELLIEIRNCFAHNNLIKSEQYHNIEEKAGQTSDSSFSKTIYYYLYEKINKFLKEDL